MHTHDPPADQPSISTRLIDAVDQFHTATGLLVTLILEAATDMAASSVLVVAGQARVASEDVERLTERVNELRMIVDDLRRWRDQADPLPAEAEQQHERGAP